MVKNQHLLIGLVAIGAINVLAILGLLSGERESTRSIKGLERDLATAREEQRQSAEKFGRATDELHRDLEETQSAIGQLRNEMERVQERLVKTRRALDAMEERLEKQAPAAPKEAGQ
jgi:septal ring factor EnvC (AmiA/AmiB activator)